MGTAIDTRSTGFFPLPVQTVAAASSIDNELQQPEDVMALAPGLVVPMVGHRGWRLSAAGIGNSGGTFLVDIEFLELFAPRNMEIRGLDQPAFERRVKPRLYGTITCTLAASTITPDGGIVPTGYRWVSGISAPTLSVYGTEIDNVTRESAIILPDPDAAGPDIIQHRDANNIFAIRFRPYTLTNVTSVLLLPSLDT